MHDSIIYFVTSTLWTLITPDELIRGLWTVIAYVGVFGWLVGIIAGAIFNEFDNPPGGGYTGSSYPNPFPRR